MDPSGGCRVCVWQGWSPPPPLECGWRHTGNVQGGGGGACECPRVGVFFNLSEGGWRHADNVQEGGGGYLWISKSGGVFQFFEGQMTSGGAYCDCLHPPPPFRKSCIRAWTPPPPLSKILHPPLIWVCTRTSTWTIGVYYINAYISRPIHAYCIHAPIHALHVSCNTF